jgi:hypothetical protein
MTRSLRTWGAIFWSAGFAVAAFDLLALDFFGWRMPISYLLFTVAAILCYAAEQREFGARVVLYRLHDLAIFSSWKYLFLYFLWISLFAGFTQNIVTSLVYGLTGWFSLVAVGFSAQFLFCERSDDQVFILPKRLRFVFLGYSISLLILFANHVVFFLFRDAAVPLLHRDPVSFFLYFSVGLPFLIWDFWNSRRHLLPRILSGTVLTLGTASLLFSERIFFLLSLGFCTAGILALAAFKRFRFRRFIFSVVFLGALSSALLFLLFRQHLPTTEMRELASYYEARLTTEALGAWAALRSSHFLGLGAGVTDIRGVWVKVAAESGVIGLLLYGLFFLSLMGRLFFVRRSPRVVVSNVALVSLGYFLVMGALHVENPYGAYIWCWYSLWSIFAFTSRKREMAL